MFTTKEIAQQTVMELNKIEGIIACFDEDQTITVQLGEDPYKAYIDALILHNIYIKKRI